MKWFDVTIGRRLVFRLYFYHAILCTCIVGAGFGIAHFTIEPAWRADRNEALAWVTQAMLTERNSPQHVHRGLTALHDRMGVDLTVFAPDGRVIASAAPAAPAPLDAQTLARVAKEGNVTLSAGVFAVGLSEEDGLVAYAVVDSQTVRPPAWRGAAILAIVLGLLGLGSYASLARAIARPLEGLADVTRAFGLGKLRARASTDRKDEIGDLGRAFNQMADRVERLRRAEKELLANVSHELRTPLARIRVVVELAGCEPQSTPRYLSAIAEDLSEVEQLLSDIITAARLDLGSEHATYPFPPLRLTPVPLASIVDGLVRRFREAHPERVVRAKIDGEDRVPVDRVMFKHALSNVLDNAHNYSPAGRPIDVALRFDHAAEGGTAIVEVVDHGQGIDPADVPHVFIPFFRTDRSRARNTGGVGLGLTLARRIVEAHEGTIELTSGPGEGTTVTIKLPVQGPATDVPT